MIANRFPILQFCLFWDRGDVPKYPTNPTSAVFCGFASLYLTLHGPYQVGFAQPYILKIICSNINDLGLCIKTCRVDVGLWRSAIFGRFPPFCRGILRHVGNVGFGKPLPLPSRASVAGLFTQTDRFLRQNASGRTAKYAMQSAGLA